MRAIVLVAAAATLAGCGSLNLSSSSTYVRADGQPVSQGQVDADQSACSSLSESTQRCMLAKGYFLVDNSKVDVKRTELAQIAAENRQREEARIAAEQKRQAELDRAARREAAKKKKKPAA